MAAEDLIAKMLNDAALLGSVAQSRPDTAEQGEDFVAVLTKAFKPSNTSRASLEMALRALAKQALAHPKLIVNDVVTSVEAIISALDGQLSQGLNPVLHHPKFQKLESAWRGLHYLVMNTETDESLKIRVLNISKADLALALKPRDSNAWDQSPLFKKVYEEEFGQFGGEPFGCLVGDYHFSHLPDDVELLADMAKVCAAAFAPFVAAADPTLMQMSSWQELANPRDLSKLFTTPDYARWRALRDSDDARYLALAMPRFLARIPYGATSNPVEEFAFEEDTAGSEEARFTWANSAYAMAANINRAFKMYGWCARIRGTEGGGAVESLPTHAFPSDHGGVAINCSTEIAISDRREAELAKNGLIPLVHRKNTDFAVFIGAQSLQKPPEHDDPDATANANLAARLPYLFAACRFSLYLKCIVRDKIGSFKGPEDMANFLNDWVMNYVDGDPQDSSETTKARCPLARAEIVVEPIDGVPGYLAATFFLQPHYQLEGLTAPLRMVTRLPSAKDA